jgi:hypothetical protein
VIARFLCLWLRLHDREIVISETGIIDLRRPLFEYQCSRCKTRWRRIPAGRFQRGEWERL